MASPGGGSSHIEIPFDLNKLFSLQYEFQPLKEVLEHIFGRLQGINGAVEEHASRLER